MVVGLVFFVAAESCELEVPDCPGRSGSDTPGLTLTLAEGPDTGMIGFEPSDATALEDDPAFVVSPLPCEPAGVVWIDVSVSLAFLVVVVFSGKGTGNGTPPIPSLDVELALPPPDD